MPIANIWRCRSASPTCSAKPSRRLAARSSGPRACSRRPGTTTTRRSSRNSGLDLRAEIRRHLRLYPEPGFPGWTGLVQQHAEPVDGAVAALARRDEQRRLARGVDNVRHERACRQLVELEIERWVAEHALARRINEHRRTGERGMALLPRQHLDRPAELLRQRLR